MDGLESESNSRVRRGRYKNRITIRNLLLEQLRQILSYEKTGTCTVHEVNKLYVWNIDWKLPMEEVWVEL
jgi:hypothetical protein